MKARSNRLGMLLCGRCFYSFRLRRGFRCAFGDAVVPVLRRSVLVEEGPSMSSGKTFQVWDTPRVAAAFNLGLLARFDL